VESNEQSTKASSTINGVEKSEFPEDDGTVTEEKAVDEPQGSDDHPGGLELLAVMVALVLSIFLFSLDQVSSVAPNFCRVVFCKSITPQ
jgi:hypothetical protein